MKPWGQHLLVDGSGADKDTILSVMALRQMLSDLVQALDVRPYGDPIIEHFGHADPRTSGYSVVQLIEESSLTGHFVDATGEFYIDLFSCKPFDAGAALGVITHVLRPQAVHALLLGRDAAGGPYISQHMTWKNADFTGIRVGWVPPGWSND